MPQGGNQKGPGELLIKRQTVFEPQGPYNLPAFRNASVTQFGAVLWPRGPQKPTAYNWGTLFSTMIFKSSDPAKEQAAQHAAVAALADEAQFAHATTDMGMPVTKSGYESAAYKRFLSGEPVVKQFIDMFPQ